MRKKLQVSVSKIGQQGNPGRGEWCDFLTAEPDEQMLRQRGTLYILVSLKGRWNLKGRSLLKTFLQNLRDYYYKKPEIHVPVNLEEALKYAHKMLISALQGEESKETLFNALAVVVWGNVLYVVQTGKAKALLFRKETVQAIGNDSTESVKEELFSNTITVASGLVKQDDRLVLALPDFWKNLPVAKLQLWIKNHTEDVTAKKIEEYFVEKKITLCQAFIFAFTIGIFPSNEEIITISIPPEEEKSIFVKKKELFLQQFKEKLTALRQKKPIVLRVRKEQEITINDFSLPESDVKETHEAIHAIRTESISESGAELKKIDSTKKLGKFVLPPVMQKAGGWLQSRSERSLAILKKKFVFIQDHFKKSLPQKEGAVSKAAVKEDIGKYLKKSWIYGLIERRGILLVLVFALLFVASIYYTNQMSQKNKQSKIDTTVYDELMGKFEDAKRVSYTDADRQKVYEEGVVKITELENNRYDGKKIVTLKGKLQEIKDSLFHIVRIADPKIVTDIRLKADNALIDQLSIVSQTLIAIDSQNHNLYFVDISNGSITTQKIPESTVDPLFVSSGEELYFYDANGIFIFDRSSKDFSSVAEKSTEWQKVVAAADYSGNLYFLDNEAKQIWKYMPSGNSYSGPYAYIRGEVENGLENSVSLAIDGTVFVLQKNGELWKYAYGARENFELKGLDVPLTNPSQVYTREEYNNIYVGDFTNRRIVTFDKHGVYAKQFVNEQWVQLKAFIVDVHEKTLYVLNGTEIFAVTL